MIILKLIVKIIVELLKFYFSGKASILVDGSRIQNIGDSVRDDQELSVSTFNLYDLGVILNCCRVLHLPGSFFTRLIIKHFGILAILTTHIKENTEVIDALKCDVNLYEVAHGIVSILVSENDKYSHLFATDVPLICWSQDCVEYVQRELKVNHRQVHNIGWIGPSYKSQNYYDKEHVLFVLTRTSGMGTQYIKLNFQMLRLATELMNKETNLYVKIRVHPRDVTLRRKLQKIGYNISFDDEKNAIRQSFAIVSSGSTVLVSGLIAGVKCIQVVSEIDRKITGCISIQSNCEQLQRALQMEPPQVTVDPFNLKKFKAIILE